MWHAATAWLMEVSKCQDFEAIFGTALNGNDLHSLPQDATMIFT